MKTKIKSIIVGLFMAISSQASAAAPSSPIAAAEQIEVRSQSATLIDQTTVFKGTVIVTRGEMTISAEQITYDPASGTLKCTGETKVENSRSITTCTDATFNLKNGIMIMPQSRTTLLQK